MKAIILLAMTLASPVFAGDRTVPIGDWSGLGTQDGQSWEMEVQIAEGGARVDYPGFPCGGIWVFDPSFLAIRGTEWLTYGKDVCLDGLAVTLSVADTNKLLIHWYDDIGAEIAHAELQNANPAGQGKKSSGGGKK